MTSTTITYQGSTCSGSAQVVVLFPDDHQQQYWTMGRFYEAGSLHHLLCHLAETNLRHFVSRGTVVDVGASIGNHTLFFVTVLGATAVVAVEPYLPSFLHLIKNLDANGLGETTDGVEVTTVLAAAGERAFFGRTERVDWPEHPNVGMVRFVPDAEGPDRMVRLDDTVPDDMRPVTYIKIDVEGEALPVLLGTARLIDEDRPLITAEHDPEEKDAVFRFLQPYGYTVAPFTLNATPTFIYVPPTKTPDAVRS